MSELTRREFLKSIGIVATAISIPVSIEVITKPFLDIQRVTKNYLVLQSWEQTLVAEVKAVDLDGAERKGVLRVVLEDNFDVREFVSFVSRPSRLNLDLFNGIPMRFEGAGTISFVYRIKEGNCVEVNLDQFRCLTGKMT